MTGAITKVQGKRKTKVGRVVSDRMDKTIVVSVERLARHRLYKRVIRLTTKFKAHDETNDAHIGDTVLIEESRPITGWPSSSRAGSSSRWPVSITTRPSRRCAWPVTSSPSRPAWSSGKARRRPEVDLNKVRSLSDAELEDALREAKQDLWQARFALSTRQLKDYSTIPQTRRTIARILTVQRERLGARAKTA